MFDDVRGPERFFFYNLYQSERTGAPLSWRNRAAGSIDAYATAVSRWLVTRDGFDFLVFYLSDFDYASHELGPGAAHDTLVRCDDAVGALVEAAGGVDELLARYAVVVMADHGQTTVRDVASLETLYDDIDGRSSARPTAPLTCTPSTAAPSTRASSHMRLDGEQSVEVALFREGREAVARRAGEELRYVPDGAGGFVLAGDASILDQPDALRRTWTALANPNAGEVLVSAVEGWEFSDLGGSHHRGGGSHGSLVAGDSEVPLLAVGIEGGACSIVDVAPLVLAHFGVEVPGYALEPAA